MPRFLLACIVLPLLAGCASLAGDSAPPSPAMMGIKAQDAAWQDDVMRSPAGGAPTFKPLTKAQAAVAAAKAQPRVSHYDGDDLDRARAALAKARSDWNAIASQEKRPVAKLATIADNAHRAQRLAEIARYTARRERNLDRLAKLSRRVQQQSESAAPGSGNHLVGKKVVPDRLGNLAFQPGTAKLTPASHAVIGRLAALLQQHPEYGIAIFGFTDNSAPADARLSAFMAANTGLAKQAKTHEAKVKAYNLALSSARARDVGFLLARRGIDPQRIGARGFGEKHPVASNDTAAGRRANRRIEAIIVPAPKNGGNSSS